MPRVIITAQVQAQIERFYQFLSERDEISALRAVQAVYQGFLALEKHPEIGRPIEDEPWLRERIIDFGDSGYVALYRYIKGEAEVTILTIRHQKETGYTQGR
jgi:plasmid stabilization system protein ParE